MFSDVSKFPSKIHDLHSHETGIQIETLS